MKIKRYEDLEIWKLSTDTAIMIYKLTEKDRFAKDYGLRDQIRRAAISISSNIVEGFEMNNNNDFIRYLRIAKGSTGETRSQLYVAHKLDYIQGGEYESVNESLTTLSAKIGSLIKYLFNKKGDKEFTTR